MQLPKVRAGGSMTLFSCEHLGPCLCVDLYFGSRPIQLVLGKPHYAHGVDSSPIWL